MQFVAEEVGGAFDAAVRGTKVTSLVLDPLLWAFAASLLELCGGHGVDGHTSKKNQSGRNKSPEAGPFSFEADRLLT